MNTKYILYPQAIKKIKESGLVSRLDKLKNSEDGIPYIGGHVFQDQMISTFEDLKQKGYYKHFPEDFKQKYQKTIDGILNNSKGYSWEVQRPHSPITVPSKLKDLLLFSGDLASMILKPEEIWNYQKFGFSSVSEFTTTIGAFIFEESKKDLLFREGYKWTRKRSDGSEIVTEITGDFNADLRIYQTDIAPYPTKDPFGNSIQMRPKTESDIHMIAPYHSTEGAMLTTIMKYIEQECIKTQYQQDKAKQLIEWGQSLGQGGGNCTEHFGGFDQNPVLFFIGYNYPIPQLNEKNETNQHTNFGLFQTTESRYSAYISHNGDLVFSHEKDSIKNTQKPITARFTPDDGEHLIKGLIYQAAKGLGRTSAKQLLDILNYRYSPKFEEDSKKYR